MAKRRSKKERELELEAVRSEKRNELIGESVEMKKLAEKFASEDDPFHFDEDEFVKRKMEEWEREQLQEPTGKYQDRRRIEAEYQKHFVEYVQECCPEVFEELREMVPLYMRVFGEKIDGFHTIFDFRKTLFLRELGTSLEAQMNFFIGSPLIFFGMHGPNFDQYRLDFPIGETRGILILLKLLLDNSESDLTVEKNLRDAKDYIEACLFFNPNDLDLLDEINTSQIPGFLSIKAEEAAKHLRTNENAAYQAKHARERLTEFLKDPDSSEVPDIEAFIDLQLSLFDWATRHHIEKDWVLRYGYFVVSRFSENPKMSVAEIEFPILNTRSLLALPFELKFNGWDAGEEKREDYEKRLREGFEHEVRMYFHDASSFLNLHLIKRASGRKYHRVKWLVRATVQGWAKKTILDEISKLDEKGDENPDEGTLRKAFKEFQKYDLPIRL